VQFAEDSAINEYRLNAGEWVTYDGSITITENALIEARSTDEAGNVSVVASINVTNIDKIAPEAVIIDAVLVDNQFEISGAEEGASVSYSIDQSEFTVYGDPVILTDGEHTITAKSVDKAGNESTVTIFTGVFYGEAFDKAVLELEEAKLVPTLQNVEDAKQAIDVLPDGISAEFGLDQQLVDATKLANGALSEDAKKALEAIEMAETNKQTKYFQKAITALKKLNDADVNKAYLTTRLETLLLAEEGNKDAHSGNVRYFGN
jgi:hypothetical protein